LKIRNSINLRLSHGSGAQVKQQTPPKTRPKTKFRLKPSVIAVYASTFALTIAIIFVGYNQPKSASEIVNASEISKSYQIDTSVDNVIATNVAASVAQAANLPIATSVSNMAVTTQSKSDYLQSNTVETSKPELVGATGSDRKVDSYTVKAGDTVDSLAIKFGISKDTIKWANKLTADTLAVGRVLRILPIDGTLYAVQSGDTIDSIAAKYHVDKELLILYNDLESTGLKQNTSIILPKGVLPVNERPGYVAPVTIASTPNYFENGSGTGFGGSTWHISVGTADGPYAYGNCTLYAYNRRKAVGLPVGDNWGNAGSWAYFAAQDGLLVNHTPGVYSIMVSSGHVAIVEKVLPNGDLSISEMNAYVAGGGFNVVSGRIVSAGNVGQYWYIH
jgi:surface antigen